ncbi:MULTISPECIES: ABC transporter substrate-binding protein [unclassified Gordonia (in: high G+C Gram-positive bacteria)]|uniref:ABC transporter substrate-binding protein n=1 Tax=unclassified Gordonia (in: high G+C Gram-positive bacteria) TaxID=2657482 RepID=UPI0009AD2765|nr:MULTISPECIES: ABC transporter substrate-binding protein [unclassified Gordonia (in: high G+C Gram-positive bacteria)]MDF3281339.1 ABC transporter substrate-binding protein [Gordonia sp. N1V]OPX10004.1 ABC transporter substrate-binding protein [Gordonia sp. i37]
MTGPVLPMQFSRRGFLRTGALLGVGVAAGSALSGCATPTGTPGPTTLSIALNRSLNSLDNKLLQYDAALTIQRAVRQSLTEIDADLKLQLVLADEFRMTSPTQWLVRLRPGIRYSDGTPVQVADVSTALKMYSQVDGSFVAAFFPEWPTVQQIDDRSFTLNTTRPVPVLDYLMSNVLITPAAANVPEDLQTGVGTGPYVVTAADRGTGNYSLTRNENYWGPRPSIGSIQVRFIPDESSRVVALRSGEIDVIDSITPDAADQISGISDITVERADGVRLNQLFYNFRKPPGSPMADARVRRALSYAIDGDSLLDHVLQGSAAPSLGVVPTRLDGAVETGRFVYDPDRARSELDQLGVRNLGITIIWETGEFAADTSIMESVVEMLGKVGVRARLQQFEPGGDIATWRQGRGGDWDVIGNGYPSPTGLALTIMQGMYAGTPEKEKTRDTYHGYQFPEVTALITRASEEPDASRRAILLADAQHKIADTFPMMWSFVPKAVVAHRSRVGDIRLRPTNSYEIATVSLKGTNA